MLKLYFTHKTRSGRVVWLLEELGLKYDLVKLEFSKEGLKSPEHRKRHPLGRVPVLEDGDVMIYESGAIIDYILERHAPGTLKPAVDAPEFPYYLQWFHYVEGMIMPPINEIVVQTVLLPPERRSEDALNKALKLLSKALLPVEQALEGKDYIVGDFMGADLMMGHACFMANLSVPFTDETPNLKAYVARVAARPAFDYAIKLK
ncbi:MAG: glutathione S-transferase family protein [Pseudomonadota bacterium]